jgi:hypothetical protein
VVAAGKHIQQVATKAWSMWDALPSSHREHMVQSRAGSSVMPGTIGEHGIPLLSALGRAHHTTYTTKQSTVHRSNDSCHPMQGIHFIA